MRHVGTAGAHHQRLDRLVPRALTLFCGDLVFHGGTPFLLMGSVAGAIDVLENVLAPLGAQTTVPGHGPVFHDRAPLDATLDYLRFVLDLAERGRAAGVTPLQAARDTDLGRFADWPDAERIVGNLHRAYAELDGLERGATDRRLRRPRRHGHLQRRPVDLLRLNAALNPREPCHAGLRRREGRMTTSRWPDHLIGLEEWHALPEDTSRRFELVEGVLSVAPRPSPRHQRLAGLLARAVDDSLPIEWCAVTEIEVVLEGGATPTVRVPDVVVLHSAAVDGRPRVVPADVLAVVEVLSLGRTAPTASPSSRSTPRPGSPGTRSSTTVLP